MDGSRTTLCNQDLLSPVACETFRSKAGSRLEVKGSDRGLVLSDEIPS